MFSGNPTVVPPGIDPNFKTAYINQWSLGVQREVAKDLVLDISYLGSEGHKLPIGVNINQALPGPGSVNSRRPFQGFGNITGGFIESIGNSNYNGLTVRVERRLTQGFSFLPSYTWSKAIDFNSGISTGSDSRQQNPTGTFGSAGRNILRGPGLNNFDLGISRFFKITERQRIQFRAEVFNLANHPNFFLPVQSLASSSFGTIQRAINSGTGAQRHIQFGLKYIF